jgi:hypothetical protein
MQILGFDLKGLVQIHQREVGIGTLGNVPFSRWQLESSGNIERREPA